MRASICAPCSPASPRCATGPPTAARAAQARGRASTSTPASTGWACPEHEVEQLAAEPDLLAAFETTLVMSHLACADDPDNPMNERQRERFDALRAKLPPAPASLANSGGTVPGPRLPFRPGAARHRALRRPRARGQGPTRCARWCGWPRGSCRCATSRPAPPSATAPPTRCSGPRASPPSPAATPTASCAP